MGNFLPPNSLELLAEIRDLLVSIDEKLPPPTGIKVTIGTPAFDEAVSAALRRTNARGSRT